MCRGLQFRIQLKEILMDNRLVDQVVSLAFFVALMLCLLHVGARMTGFGKSWVNRLTGLVVKWVLIVAGIVFLVLALSRSATLR